MPKWNDGLIDAFPIPLDYQLAQLKLQSPPSQNPDLPSTSAIPSTPFPFFSLPAEIRNRIYKLVLFCRSACRLSSSSFGRSHLSILLASRRFHLEASYTLYTNHKFLIFPIQLFNALPTIQELPLHYRLLTTNLEMVVGPSWTNPLKSWRVTKPLTRCLAQLKGVETLDVFVDFDPSHPAFRRYRISYDFYTDFCGDLLADVLEAMPQLRVVRIDGNGGVDVHGPLVTRLREEALEQEKIVKWGKQANWGAKFDESKLKAYEELESVRLGEVHITSGADDTLATVVASGADKTVETQAGVGTAASKKGKAGTSSKTATNRPPRVRKKRGDENFIKTTYP